MNCKNCNHAIPKEYINTELYSCGFCSIPCFMIFTSHNLLEMQRDIMELRGLLNSKIVFKNLEGERLI
jgi:hypothetical protein